MTSMNEQKDDPIGMCTKYTEDRKLSECQRFLTGPRHCHKIIILRVFFWDK